MIRSVALSTTIRNTIARIAAPTVCIADYNSRGLVPLHSKKWHCCALLLLVQWVATSLYSSPILPQNCSRGVGSAQNKRVLRILCICTHTRYHDAANFNCKSTTYSYNLALSSPRPQATSTEAEKMFVRPCSVAYPIFSSWQDVWHHGQTPTPDTRVPPDARVLFNHPWLRHSKAQNIIQRQGLRLPTSNLAAPRAPSPTTNPAALPRTNPPAIAGAALSPPPFRWRAFHHELPAAATHPRPQKDELTAPTTKRN